MDTSTHFVTGISIAGLAHIDPIIATNPSFAQLVLIGTLIGSQAPDFDGISKFFGNASYIRNHRGINHSIPAILLWTTIISLTIYLLFKPPYFYHLWVWVFASVFFHVFLDVFNTYGTQALRPFTAKWIALNILNIFDPFIFITHSLGIIFWVLQWYKPSTIFSSIYLITILYFIWRSWTHYNIKNKLTIKYQLTKHITLLPTIYWSLWNIIEETDHSYRIGIVRKSQLEWIDIKTKQKLHPSILASKNDPKVKALLYFTKFAFPIYKQTAYGYEVRWIDLRYRFNNHYPFNTIVLLDDSLHIINSYIGWVYNEHFLHKKVQSLLKAK